jgi:hypothetical protein
VRIRLAGAHDDRATELLAALAEEASSAGGEVALGDDAPGERDVTLFVPLAGGSRPIPRGLDARRSIAVCPQYPGDSAFDVATTAAAAAGGTLALSPLGALEQRRRGVASMLLPLGLASRWRTAPRPASGRERDAVFAGAHSPRRERLLARNAPSLARLRCEIRLGAVWPGSQALLGGPARRRLLASSSVVLDIHPRRPHGLDRVLALEAIGAGALLLSEHAVETGPLVCGTHFEAADGSQLGLAARRLLDDPERLDRIAAEARAFADAELSPRPGAELLLGLAETVSRRAARHERWRLGRRGSRLDGCGAPPSPGIHAGTAPAPVAERPGLRRKREALAALERRGRTRARMLEQRGLDRELRCVFESPAWSARDARQVAVCVPMHDDGDLALRALESAARSFGVDVELLVADDASADDSLDRVREWLRERPELPARLLASAVNRGVGAARNAMLVQARAPLAFMLDADNLLFSDGLRKLVAATEAAPRALFAYGLLERCREGRSVGLLNTGAWEPERLRDGNYIDAMALLRRREILAMGGFAEDRRLYGWEDFDLWCRVAELGREGVFVPEFVGRYRQRMGSMLSLAEIDVGDAVALLRERSPVLSPSIPAIGGL